MSVLPSTCPAPVDSDQTLPLVRSFLFDLDYYNSIIQNMGSTRHAVRFGGQGRAGYGGRRCDRQFNREAAVPTTEPRSSLPTSILTAPNASPQTCETPWPAPSTSASAASVEDAIATIIERYGRLDILVNNAGVNTLAHRVNIDEFPVEEWDRITGIDLDGLYIVSRAALQPMLAAGRGGRIVNIASVVGLAAMRLQSPFVAAKAGIIHLTRSMAIELGAKGILTNAIAPGSVSTELTAKLFYGDDGKFAGRTQDFLAHVPLGRPGRAGGNRRGSAVSRLARRKLHQRPGSGRRWRLDRGIHDVSAAMEIDLNGATVALEGDFNPIAEAAWRPCSPMAAMSSMSADRGCRYPADILSAAAGDNRWRCPARLHADARKSATAMAERGQGRIIFLMSAIAGMPMRRHPGFSTGNASDFWLVCALWPWNSDQMSWSMPSASGLSRAATIVSGDEAMLSHTPVGRAGSIEEAVAAVLFLLRPAQQLYDRPDARRRRRLDRGLRTQLLTRLLPIMA